ncbi:uncharacterized protein LOC123553031 isoform X2 [Mercenaria mercenaria]|uniref:uncharacterized protein LOC123553031 isoform X2 n=1 Tax=Mercenaria mercenaria TaxID=6596 RepID=UPI00234F9D16|nr:uncharacterized protein LOC123553031 isoform X2 [Mercenaria mercenaria]
MKQLRTVIVFACLGMACCHICLITPRQRGTMDISMPGSPTCTRHAEPCGGQDIETPKVTYMAGESAFFKWQQNLNHYESGYPGYMDIGIARSENSTDFTTLAVVTDKYVHRQDYQQNFTVKIPSIMCDHCVVRMRYNAHKPGETTFLQCADIKISLGSKSHDGLKFSQNHEESRADKQKLWPLNRALRLRKLHQKLQKDDDTENAMKLYGIAYNPFEPQRSHYISIDTMSGQTEMVNSFKFGIDAPGTGNNTKMFLLDEVLSIDYGRNTTNFLVHETGSRDDVAKRLYVVGTYNGSLVQYTDLFQFSGGAINGLSWYTYGTSAAFRIQPAETANNWYFEVGMLVDGGYKMAARIPKPEGLYVNFQWFETDVNNYHRTYTLMGNENAPDELNARIYIFDIYDSIFSKFVKYTELDVSKYTFMSMHSYPGSDELYAFSPGLWFDDPHAWYLVAINPMSGEVTKKCDIAPPGIFQRYYGGTVNQGSTNHGGYLYHVLRVDGSDADLIVKIHPGTCQMTFSEPTNLRHIHSLQMPAM